MLVLQLVASGVWRVYKRPELMREWLGLLDERRSKAPRLLPPHANREIGAADRDHDDEEPEAA